MKKEKVIFLDRDGTINEEVNYLYRPEDFVFVPGAPEALAMLKKAGFKLVVVTNQAGVARGYYTEKEVENLHRYINERLKEYGGEIDAFFYCPHHPEHGIGKYKVKCSCRKPETGMLQAAEKLFEVDKEHSYMIGDKLADTIAGHRFGIKSILVGTGYGKEIKRQQTEQQKEVSEYDVYAETLMDASRYILGEEGRSENEYESLS